MQIPVDKRIEGLADIPYTISYIIRKRQQIDNLNELPKNKRPTEEMIWDGTSEEIEEWLDKVFDKKHKDTVDIVVKPTDIEGR